MLTSDVALSLNLWVEAEGRRKLDEIRSESLPLLFNPAPFIQYEACLCADDNWEQKVDINRTDWPVYLNTFGRRVWLHVSARAYVWVTGALAESPTAAEWLVKPAALIIPLYRCNSFLRRWSVWLLEVVGDFNYMCFQANLYLGPV